MSTSPAVQCRRSRKFGVLVSIYDAEGEGFDPSGGPWVTVCEAHGTICNHETLAQARAHAPWLEWCEECQASLDEGDAS